MFSRNLERVLNDAAREALSRRHVNLTLEHLLFAVAGEPEGPGCCRRRGPTWRPCAGSSTSS